MLFDTTWGQENLVFLHHVKHMLHPLILFANEFLLVTILDVGGHNLLIDQRMYPQQSQVSTISSEREQKIVFAYVID